MTTNKVSFNETEVPAVLEVRAKVFGDSRGFFTETYNFVEWGSLGFSSTFVQDNMSKSAKGTLRGMHYQIEPHGMGKLVRVVRGAAFDVAVDLRRGSPTFGRWVGRELSEENLLALWIPAGFAHGFLALEDNTVLSYKCTSTYVPTAERSVHFADPEIGIAWPFEPLVVSDRDASAPPLAGAEYNFVMG